MTDEQELDLNVSTFDGSAAEGAGAREVGSRAGGPVIVPFSGAVVRPVVRVSPSGVSPSGAAAAGPVTSAHDPFAVATDAVDFGSKEIPGSQEGAGPETFRSARERVIARRAGNALDASVGAPSGSSPVTSDALSATILRWARTTTPEELTSRGIRRVRSISMSRVGALLEKAVNRALIERTLESDTDDALSLSTTARREFLRLSRDESADAEPPLGRAGDAVHSERPLRERATSTLDRLRRELEERRRLLADREKRVSDGDLDSADDTRLAESLRELFAEHAGVDDRRLQTEVLQLVVGELSTARRKARLARLEEHQREMGTLERRITKLSALLGETEDALRRVRAGKKVDAGVSSIYDEVQGLGEGDDQFEQKSELMKALFEANLALR